MASQPPSPSLHQHCNHSLHPSIVSHPKSSSKLTKVLQNHISQSTATSRRIAITGVLGTILLPAEAILKTEEAWGFEFRMTVPDQTLEEAETGIKTDAQDLLDVKYLIELESWREAQKALRKSSSNLKQDIYTIIQAKPGKERPLLRQLYSQLFNNVTDMDYAARSEDANLVKECYGKIVVSLDAILSKL